MVVLEREVHVAVKRAHATARDDLVVATTTTATTATTTAATAAATSETSAATSETSAAEAVEVAAAEGFGGEGIVVDANLRDLAAATGAAAGGALPYPGALGHGAFHARPQPHLALLGGQHFIHVSEKRLAHVGDAGERLVELIALRRAAAEVEHLAEEVFRGTPLLVHGKGDGPHLLVAKGHLGFRQRLCQRLTDLVERVLDYQARLFLGKRRTRNQAKQHDSCQ